MKVEGPNIYSENYVAPLKINKVNIGTVENPNMASIGDYWDNQIVERIIELLSEYNDLFLMKFLEIKSLGEMNIPLKPEARPIRQIPYRLNQIYKEKVKEKIDKMLEVGVIEPMEKSEWISPMVVQEKNQGGTRICKDLRKFNDFFLHDLFPTLFKDEVLENVGGQEAYSFTDGFSRYHHIRIAPKDRHNTTYATKWGSFQYIVIPFGLKNVATMFSRVLVAAIKDFIHKFLEVYFDDWIMFSLLKDHVEVLMLMLDICRQCQISLNIKKFIFNAPFGILFWHVMCKQGLLVDPAKIDVIVNLPLPKLVF
jgi:hypothetical protein